MLGRCAAPAHWPLRLQFPDRCTEIGVGASMLGRCGAPAHWPLRPLFPDRCRKCDHSTVEW